VVLALDAPRDRVAGQVINVGVDELNTSFGRSARSSGGSSRPPRSSPADRSTDKRNYYVRFDKARELLGFTPTRELEDGVRELVDALIGGSVGEYHSARYHNVISLSETFADRARFADMLSTQIGRQA